MKPLILQLLFAITTVVVAGILGVLLGCLVRTIFWSVAW